MFSGKEKSVEKFFFPYRGLREKSGESILFYLSFAGRKKALFPALFRGKENIPLLRRGMEVSFPGVRGKEKAGFSTARPILSFPFHDQCIFQKQQLSESRF